MRHVLTAILALGVAPCWARTITVNPGAGAQETLQSALIDAKSGDTILIKAGQYDLTDGLSLDVAGVSVVGEGGGKTLLAFDGQKGGAEGLLVTANNTVIRGIAIRNPKGNGIKAKGVDGLTILDVAVEWTGQPKSTNGAYGVYPVSSSHILIDGVHARGASDTGIYVGQSKDIVIQNNKVDYNVAGIEIENCYHADVHDNLSTHNTGGILVFDLPGLPQMGGHSTRVFHNRIVDNDTPNFAAPGNIVGNVPMGTGVMVMANRDIHVFGNDIENNASGAVLLVAYVNAFDDKRYDPLPRDISVHGNRTVHNGFAPAYPGGAALVKAVGGALPPVTWDGVVRYTHPGGGASDEVVNLAISDGPVLNLNLKDQGTPTEKANPTVSPDIKGAAIAAPDPVVLPASQLSLLSGR